MNLLSLNQLLSAIGGRGIGFDLNQIEFDSVSIDSRTVQPGELFWAIQGEKQNGHQFVKQAIQKGAVAVVVNEGFECDINIPTIVVKDTTIALKAFASWYRQTVEPFVIGITGSVGKTTTRTMTTAVLNKQFDAMQSPKNYNNQFGLSLSLLDIKSHHEFAVLEMGASHVGEIAELATMATPQIGIVTKIGTAHIGSFGGQQQIIQSKGELVEALPRTGVAILNGDDPHVRSLAKRTNCAVQFVGEGDDNHVQASQVSVDWNRLSFNVGADRYRLNVVGRHHLTSALCAIAVGRQFGMSATTIQNGFNKFKAVNGRCQLQRVGQWDVIDDSYNANPTSMRAACDIVKTWQGTGKRMMLVGDMLEMGAESNRYHVELGNRIAHSRIDHLFALGDQAEQVIQGARESGLKNRSLSKCDNMETMLSRLEETLQPEDLIVVKGSRGMKMERVIDWLRHQTITN